MREFDVTIKLFLGGFLVFSVVDIIIAISHLNQIAQ